MCCAEQLNVWEQSLDQGSRQNAIFRYPMPAQVPAQTDQSAVGFGSNMFQNLIESRAPWRPDPALVRPSSQELPIQAQSQRTNYAPVPLHPSMRSQVNFGLIKPEQTVETFSQTQQGLQKPVPGPDLFPDIHDEVVMGPDFEPKAPEPANSVQVQCGEVSVKVQVKQDFLGNNQFIDPSDLMLGGCPFVGFDDHARIVAFESALQGCGSTLTMTEDSLVYSFVLVYSPSPLPNTPIVKTNEAMVAIHCIYPRKHNVSSNSLHPTWIPFAASRAGDEYLHFSLKIMSDDWRYERPSNAFFLGDFINLEVSVVRGNHVPLRVFVESCAATLGPSGEANSVYTFIENSGCMLDAKLTNSRSRFMPRIQDDKLQFQIEAFRFKQDSRGSIYITCHLKATTTSSPIDMTNKACSFVHETNGWTAANGDDQVCGCCETSCAMRKARSLDTDDSTLEDEATIGPIFVQQLLPLEKEPLLQIQESYQEPTKDAEYSIELVLITVLVVSVGILCVFILGTLFCQRRQKLHALACE
ncbi:zona pellucida sperm-binding protein 3-like [Rhinichthys klamathensis goyatoka]|uniref:zona pellucida sperm-binding protein 3-like n=1 Tax=Rhinichthys klamathensis goyatoka TaxID=3034132 RepID=UPI0024B58614|nr:zona pellucida sperm-binding protein 3-like [Rhinichthys klamathensis goyatoka]